jgi:hypothetical protein
VSGFPATTVAYTPNAGFSGTDSFQFTLTNIAGTSSPATATITVTGGSCGATATQTQAATGLAKTNVLAASGSCPSQPTILFNGIDVTGQTTTVVVGQPINLAVAPAPAGVQTQQWLLNGRPWPINKEITVGGYAPGPNCPTNVLPLGSPQPACAGLFTQLPAFTNSSTPTFYWTVPDTYTVTYRYTLSDGTRVPPLDATFTVEGPTYASANVPPPTPLGPPFLNKNNVWVLAFGGIIFTPVVVNPTNPIGYNGRTSWIQTILNDKTVKYTVTTMTTCFGGIAYPAQFPYLDNVYPYNEILADGISANDGPTIPLEPAYNRENWKFDARMYLMWTAPIANAIPVPLGYVPWGFDGTAVKDKKTGVWSLTSTTTTTPSFVPKPLYPEWAQVELNGTEACNN